MNNKLENAVAAFCEMLPENKIGTPYQSQPNDDKRLIEIAYRSHCENVPTDELKVRLTELLVKKVDYDVTEYADSVIAQISSMKQVICLLDNSQYLVK